MKEKLRKKLIEADLDDNGFYWEKDVKQSFKNILKSLKRKRRWTREEIRNIIDQEVGDLI